MQSHSFSLPKWTPRFLRTLGSILIVMAVVVSCSDGSSPTPPVDDDEDPPPPTFPTLQGVIDQMSETAESFPAIAKMVDLTSTYGTPETHGGRRIYAIKISDNVAQEEDEPVFLIVAGYHGNEIGGPVVALDAITRFTEGYGTDITISQLVDEYEIWIAPVWNVDGYPESRKNSRPGGPVDLNRNYPFLWNSSCSGSTNTTSGNYKGPSPGSEPETKTMMAFSEDQRFTKVLDFHTSGRITVFGYRCNPHQLSDFLETEAIALAEVSSYGGDARQPSGEGEHYHWQLGTFSNYAFLTELSDTQSPSYSSALEEAARVWPGTIWMLQRPIPIWGHIIDATSSAPLSADISYVENPFTQGERNTSEPRFGRYHAFLPVGDHTLSFSHPGYVTQNILVTVTTGGTRLEVALMREPE